MAKPLVRVSLATNEKAYGNGQGCKPQWHNLVHGTAKQSSRVSTLRKEKVAIQGRLSHRSLKQKMVRRSISTEIIVNEVLPFGRKRHRSLIVK
ncbi:MAG: single-stranded DNA-binding protein [Saprospiraceae bacterium]|nr:single-stranded DNA-binding protein [Saprospiraceae bacterium]